MTQQYLIRQEAAAYLTDKGLPIAPRYLEKLASVGGGPAFQKFGKRAVYTVENLDAWIASRMSAPRLSTTEGSVTC